MAFQFAESSRNAAVEALVADFGTAPILRIRTGAKPANVAAASSGTILAEMTLPSDPFAAASGGAIAKSGTWEDTAGNAAGDAGHWEIVASDGTTRKAQGTVTITGGGGDMELVNINIAVGQPVTITAFTITAGGA